MLRLLGHAVRRTGRTVGNWIDDPELNPYRLAEGRTPARSGEVVVNSGAAETGGLKSATRRRCAHRIRSG